MPQPLKVGTTLDNYRVTSLLSDAGVSSVYRARHAVTGEDVALKFLPIERAADDNQRLRFVRQARYVRAIGHPAIPRIHETGETKQGLYIAMEYVAGGNLGRFLAKHGPLPLLRVVSMLTPVAKALDAAHAAGIIHRDVKPSNILVASGGRDHADGTCLVTDFGLSAAPSYDARRLTQAGTFVGTVLYASPEQITGETVDDRVDVYALGCVVCECLTGQPPFPRERLVDVVAAHVSEQPPAVSSRQRGLPPALDAVIARALAKKPAARYPTCLALIEAVGRTLQKPIVPAIRRAGERTLARLDVDWQRGTAELQIAADGDPLKFYWDCDGWVARQR